VFESDLAVLNPRVIQNPRGRLFLLLGGPLPSSDTQADERGRTRDEEIPAVQVTMFAVAIDAHEATSLLSAPHREDVE
jgi:hypothetical protein